MNRRPGFGEELTFRERQILQLRCQGKTVDDVGVALFITRNTVKTIMLRAYMKLGAANLGQAVQRAIFTGQLAVDPDAPLIEQPAPKAKPEPKPAAPAQAYAEYPSLRWAEGEWIGALDDPALVEKVVDGLARRRRLEERNSQA